MLIYDGTKTDFLRSVELDTIAEEIENHIKQKMYRSTVKSEFLSWDNSLQYMYKVLNDTDIPANAGVAIEYNIPQTSKRVDFIISGYDENERSNVIIIELKQWTQIHPIEGSDGLVLANFGRGLRSHVHPSYQAWSYAMLIKDYNQVVQEEKITLSPCCYLHNYRREKPDLIDSTQYQLYIDEAPVFAKGDVDHLRTFIKKSIFKGDNKELLYRIEHGKIKPSKSLQDSLASMLAGNQEFIMIDEQKIVFEDIIKISGQSQQDQKKRVVIVQGGPGTGKTVVAVNLLSSLTNKDQFCQYVSKNSAPRNVYQKLLKGKIRKSSVDNLFKGSGIYVDVDVNTMDTIIVDEAHRLNEKSGMFQNIGENQIKEIIHAAKCSVFFIDENQKVTTKDIGSIDEIMKWAKYHNAEVTMHELTSQFRCNGSDGYLAWLDNVLDIRETTNYDMNGIDYDIQIVDDPHQLHQMILERNKANNKARMLAGYCWDWPSEKRNDSSYHDIRIGNFGISWNLSNTSTFAIDVNSVNEAGCIHTAQGLEFEYVGVIIGEDLRFENGQIVTDFTKRASTDTSLKGIKTLYKKNPLEANKIADEIIKNTYRTLMTRGMKGCYVYCVDSNLAQYLKERI